MTARATAKDTEITGLTCDSRRVAPGFLFAALPGTMADGRNFIDEAVQRGAAAVLAPPGTRPPGPPADALRQPVPMMVDDNPRRLFALLAARFYDRQPATIAAVTGTNGKTSVVSFLRQIWCRLGRRAASLGTLGIDAPHARHPASLTTPDPVDLHASLSDLAAHGVACLALEASSHGLAQHRLDGVRVNAALFTNLSRDHLDYHGTMDAYLAAKLRLFDEIAEPGAVAVLNTDAPYIGAVRAVCRKRRHRVFTYGSQGGDVRLAGLEATAEGQRLALAIGGRSFSATLPVVGAFQAENALGALALALALGEDTDGAIAALEGLEGVPGRVQRVACHANGAPIYVDYAHTADALAHVLAALRPQTRGRLVVVFGCGGDRDPGKRPEMGKTARRLADAVIVTDDNPRGEDAARIRAQILADCPGAQEIGDRAEAIQAAVAGLAPGDLLVVAGKGHEQGQIIGGTVRPFDDAEAVRAAVAEAG